MPAAVPAEVAAWDTVGKSKGKKKSKKKAADLDSVFAALDQNGTPENGDADPGVAPPDSMTSGAQPDNEADELAAFGKKKKKSSKQKGHWDHTPTPALCWRVLLSAQYCHETS